MKKYYLLFLFSLTVLISGCSAGDQTVSAATLSDPIIIEKEPIVAEGDLLPSPSIELAFQQSGTVTDILVTVGDNVQAGEKIAVLQGYENAKAQWEMAKLEQKLAQQSLDEMTRNALSSDIETHQLFQKAQEEYEKEANRWSLGDKEKATELELLINDYIQAEEKYQDARTELEKYNYENETHPLRENAQQTYDDEINRLQQAYQDLLAVMPDKEDLLNDKQLDILISIGNLETTREKLNRLENGLDEETITIANAQLDTANQNVTAAEETMQAFCITSPIEGTVMSISKLKIGDLASAGHPVFYIANDQQWIVETIDLAEMDITRVKINSPATIKLDGIPNETFTGTVSEIDAIGYDYLGDNTYMVTIRLDNSDPRFLWNMTATVSID